MRWLRKPEGEPLAVSMSSIKLGDRLLFVGGSDVGLIVALATKAGLTGRTCLVDESESIRARTSAQVEGEGALIESFTAPYDALPFEEHAFDVIILRNVIGALKNERESQVACEAYRVLRPGGRCIVIEGATRSGLAAIFGGKHGDAAQPGDALEPVFANAGFRGVRTLAEREGLLFVEGVKAGTG